MRPDLGAEGLFSLGADEGLEEDLGGVVVDSSRRPRRLLGLGLLSILMHVLAAGVGWVSGEFGAEIHWRSSKRKTG